MADNLNIKNPSVTEGELDLRTDSSGNIVSISGHSIAGGAGGGNVYFGDDEYIKFKTGTTNTFTLTDGVKDTINHIPQIVSTEVSRISYTKNDIDDRLDDKQNKLTFEYDEDNKVSAINGSALAGQGGTTYTEGDGISIANDTISISADYIQAITSVSSVSGDVETLKTASSTFLTKTSADTDYYLKTNTSSKDELDTAFGSKQDNLTQEQLSAISSVSSIKGTILTGDSNIRTTSSEDGNNIKWTLELTAQPTVTDTTLSGYDGIVATKDGTVSSQWNVGIAQAYKEQIEAVSSKLTKASADTLYAPISVTGDVDTLKSSSGDWDKVSDKLDTTAFSNVSGNFLTAHQSLDDYATTSDISDMATQTWVGQQGFYTKASGDNDYAPKSVTSTINTLTGASAGWNEVTAKLDKSIYSNASGNWEASYNVLTAYSAAGTWLTAHQSLTNYYTKSETSGKSEIENALTGKQDKLTFAGESNTITSINNSAVGGVTSFTGVTTAGSISGDGLTNPLGLVTSAEQALSAVDGKVSKPTPKQQQGSYVVWDKGPAQAWSDFGVAANNWANNFLFDEESPIVNGANGLSAGLITGEFNDVYQVGIDTTNMAANKQYAFTTTGWAEVQAGTSFTGVATGVGLSGIGLSNSPLGIDTNAAINFTNGSAKSATSALSANKANSAQSAKWLRDDNASISASDVTALQNWASSNSSTWNGITAKLGTAQYANDSATFVTSSNSTITGTKQYALTTTGWASVETAYLPLTGGTVSGLTTISGSDFDNTLEVKRAGQDNNYAHIGLNNSRGLSFKAFDTNASTNVQFDLFPNNSNSSLIQVQHNGSTVGYLIPAVTATTTAGLTDDGILHIIIES